jgi:hypothetical protein
MSTAPQYTGELRRGTEPSTVIGRLVDSFGWVIELRGTLDPATREYRLEGRLGATPPSLHIDTIDGPRDIAGRRVGQAQQQPGPGPRAEEPAG